MLEGLVAGLLNKILGSYVDNLDTKQLNIGVWGGHVSLHNLRIKPEALDKLGIPIEITSGLIGTFTLEIPWSNLRNKSLTINIEDIYLSIHPQAKNSLTRDELEQSQQALKQEQLDSFEILRKNFRETLEESSSNPNISRKQSFIEYLIAKLTDNIQIYIERIHLRFEDNLSDLEKPYSLGLTLYSLRVTSTDASFTEYLLSTDPIPSSCIHKIITVDYFSIYWISKCEISKCTTTEDIFSYLKNLIPSAEKSPAYNYILKPLRATAHVVLFRHPTDQIMQLRGKLSVEEISITLSDHMYYSLLGVIDYFRVVMKQQYYLQYRPKSTPKEKPLEWFKYAILVVKDSVHESRYHWTWKYFKRRRDDRIAYMHIIRKRYLNEQISKEEIDLQKKIEKRNSTYDLIKYRSRVHTSLIEERNSIYLKPKTSAAHGLYDWFSGYIRKPQSQDEDTLASTDKTAADLTDQEQKEFFSAIEWSGQLYPDTVNLDPDMCMANVEVSIAKGSFVIQSHINGRVIPLIKQRFESFATECFIRPQSLKLKVSLKDLDMFDGITNPELEPARVIFAKPSVEESESLQKIPEAYRTHLFFLLLDTKPVYKASSTLIVHLRTLVIIYNRVCIESLLAFFVPPRTKIEHVSEWGYSAAAKVMTLARQTRASLDYALEMHKTSDMTIDLQAPLIVVREECTDLKSPTLFLDVGRALVHTQLVDDAIIDKFRKLQSKKINNEQLKQLENLMYDKFTISLFNVRCLIGPDYETGWRCLPKGCDYHILKECSLDINFEISILQKATNLTKFKVSSHMKHAEIMFSDVQYKVFINMMSNILPTLPVAEIPFTYQQFLDAVKPPPFFDAPDNFQITHTSLGSHANENTAAQFMAQQIFAFYFKVDYAICSLYRRSENYLIPVVRAFTEFYIDLVVRKFDYLVTSKLNDLVIKEFTYPSSLCDNVLVRSSPSPKNNFDDTVFISYTSIDYDSPELDSVYEGVRTTIAVVLSDLILNVEPTGFSFVYDFIRATFTSLNDEYMIGEDPELTRKISPVEGIIPEDANVRFDNVDIFLYDCDQHFSTVCLYSANMHMEFREKFFLQARFYDLEVKNHMKSNNPPKTIVKIDDNDLFIFKYESYDIPKDISKPTCDCVYDISFGSLTFYFQKSYFNAIYDFLLKLKRFQELFSSIRYAIYYKLYGNKVSLTYPKFELRIKHPKVYFDDVLDEERNCRMQLIVKPQSFYAFSKCPIVEKNSKKSIFSCEITKVEFHTAVPSSSHHDVLMEENNVHLDLTYDANYTTGAYVFKATGDLDPVILNMCQSHHVIFWDLIDVATTFARVDSSFYTSENLRRELDKAFDRSGTAAKLKHPKKTVVETLDILTTFNLPEIRLNVHTDDFWIHGGDLTQLHSILSFFGFSLDYNFYSSGRCYAEFSIDSIQLKDCNPQDNVVFLDVLEYSENHNRLVNGCLEYDSQNPRYNLVLDIDSPKIFVNLNYLYSIWSIFVHWHRAYYSHLDYLTEVEYFIMGNPNQNACGEESYWYYRITFVDMTLLFFRNVSDANLYSLPMFFGELLITQQSIFAVTANNMKINACPLSETANISNQLADPFGFRYTYSQHTVNKIQIITNITLDFDSFVLRTTVNDFLFLQTILRKIYNFYYALYDVPTTDVELLKRTKDDQLATNPDFLQLSVDTGQPSSVFGIRICKEEFLLTVDGIRLLVISQLHDLPLLNINIKPFQVDLNDWSSELNSNAHLELFMNFYNFSNSHWEPFLEPWKVGVHISRNPNTSKTAVHVFSREKLDLVITPQLIETLHFGFTKVISTPFPIEFKCDAPYRIHNYTGHAVSVWADFENAADSCVRHLENNEETDWKFEEWRQMQDVVKQDQDRSYIGFHFENSKWESLRHVRVNRVGEHIYPLISYDQDELKHYMVVDVNLGEDYIKHITLRSPLLLINETQMEIDVVFCDSDGIQRSQIYHMSPEESCSLPIETAYYYSIHIRPVSEFKFNWTSEAISWKDLVDNKQSLVTCQHSDNTFSTPACRFAANAELKSQTISNHYPFMHITISALLEVKNLLPIDLNIRIIDKDQEGVWMSNVGIGECAYVHSINISHVLLLQAESSESHYLPSSLATIITNDSAQERDEYMTITLQGGRKTRLGLSYTEKYPGIYHIEIFSPYIIINKSGSFLFVGPKNDYNRISFSSASLSSGEDGKVVPCMFSYSHNYGSRRCRLRADNSNWSEPVSFDAIGSVFEVELPSKEDHNKVYRLGIFVETGPDGYSKTNIVTITSRFIVRNKTRWSLVIAEPYNDFIAEIAPEGEEFLTYLRKHSHPMLKLSSSDCYLWSSSFYIEEIGSTHVRLMTSEGEKLLRLEIVIKNATIFISIFEETGDWPYYIKNESGVLLKFWQVNPIDASEGKNNTALLKYHDIPPHSEVKYSWDYPCCANKEIALCYGDQKCLTTLAEIGPLSPFKFTDASNNTKFISRDIVANGLSKILILKDYDPSKAVRKPKIYSKVSTEERDFNLEQFDSGIDLSVKFLLEGIGISLVERNTQELAYLTFHGINLFFTDSHLIRTFKLDVRWIQIDNQLYGGIYPIILYPSILSQEDTMNDNSLLPTFHSMVAVVKNDTYGVTYVKYATILLQELTIEIDEDFAFAALEYIKDSVPRSKRNTGKMFDDSLELVPENLGNDLKVYFEVLNLQPTEMHLSFVRTERINNTDGTVVSSHNPFVFFVNVLSMAIGNINDAPVRLNALLMDNAHVSLRRLFELVKNHYSQELLSQVHKIVGSADFLGNPVGLFTTITSGFADIFYEPFHGFILNEGSYELGIGFAKGTASFIKKAVFGITDSISKVTGTISRSLSVITLDPKFQSRRRAARIRNRPVHILYGVTAGAASLYTGVRSGVRGLALQPIIGARRNGLPGLVKGLGKGLVGFTTKPLVGLFDFASSISEGARNTTTVFDERHIEKLRLSRLMSDDGVVYPFQLREALGQYWLKHLDNGRYFKDFYKAHIIIENKVLVILTNNRILFVQPQQLNCKKEIHL
nr:RecName: Full=Intermembrane lipid transfer protein vps1301; AltName: Full=Vacuolar protein sorting-associated protein 13a [Schizosaccharomyces pombe 972h-]